MFLLLFSCTFQTCKQAERTVKSAPTTFHLIQQWSAVAPVTHPPPEEAVESKLQRETHEACLKRGRLSDTVPEHSLDVIHHDLRSDFPWAQQRSSSCYLF